MRFNFRLRLFDSLMLTVLLALVGCSGAAPRFAIEGTVTVDGEALDRGTLTLISQSDAQNQVRTPIEQGRWSFSQELGPIAGSYHVLIEAPQPEIEEVEAAMQSGADSPLVSQMFVPPKYSEPGALSLSVGEQLPLTHEFNLEVD